VLKLGLGLRLGRGLELRLRLGLRLGDERLLLARCGSLPAHATDQGQTTAERLPSAVWVLSLPDRASRPWARIAVAQRTSRVPSRRRPPRPARAAREERHRRSTRPLGRPRPETTPGSRRLRQSSQPEVSATRPLGLASCAGACGRRRRWVRRVRQPRPRWLWRAAGASHGVARSPRRSFASSASCGRAGICTRQMMSEFVDVKSRAC